MKKIKIIQLLKRAAPVLMALVVFGIMIFGTLSYLHYQKDTWEKDVKGRLFEILMTKKTKLEKALFSRIHYTRSVAAYVSLRPDITNEEFSNLAKELINNDSVISTIGLSRNCIINALYPSIGHEAAIGLNLLLHPERREIVEKTIETHRTFIAGPVDLVEGGEAFISYTPIFDKSKGDTNDFWGVTDIVIYQDKLLEMAQLKPNEGGFQFALRGYNGMGNTGDVWWGNPNVFNQHPVEVTIDLPHGNWVLAAIPEVGWSSYLNQDHVLLILLVSGSFIISLLIWMIAAAMLRIQNNERELSAIFQSMNSLVIEFDREGKYIKIPSVNQELLVRPKEFLLNKKMEEIFPKEQADLFKNAILKCLETKDLVTIEYPLEIREKRIWFAARISWKSENRVIFHAFDITEAKNAQQKIEDSEKRLRELNATKDKFFSIIAHDLKSPFNVILGFSELLRTNYDRFDEPQRKELVERIDETAQNTYYLLENLLMWAGTQNNKLEIHPETVVLKKLVDEALIPYLSGAHLKKLDVANLVSPDLSVVVDKYTMRTVIGNLFNNSVKFTNEFGQIKWSARVKNQQVEVAITDTGVGIKPQAMDRLFKIEQSQSTLGTNKEKGTGLGLFLCKEFVEKNGGEIRVESEWGAGSTFYFTVPLST